MFTALLQYTYTDFRHTTVSLTELSLVLHLQLRVSMIIMSHDACNGYGTSLPQENSGTESPTPKFMPSQG